MAPARFVSVRPPADFALQKVDRHGGPVLRRHEARVLAHHFGHAAAKGIARGRQPGFERIGQRRNGPAALFQRLRLDRRRLAAAGKGGIPGEPRSEVTPSGKVAWRMAGAAMGRTPDQSPPPIPCVAAAVDRPGIRVVKEGRAPQLQPPTLIEGEAHRMSRRRVRNWRHRLEGSPEIGDVLIGEIGVERIGKSRVVRGSVWPDALPHRFGELLDRPGAKATDRVGGQVRWVERAKRRIQRRAARQGARAASKFE